MFTFRLNRILTGVAPLFLAFTLSACGGGGGEASAIEPVTGANAALLSTNVVDNDTAILQAVYFDDRTPDGFYSESYPDSDVYYSTSHVKNVELLPIVDRAGMARYELSTDDFAEALAWSEAAANNQPAYKQLVDNRETELYFEFTRVDLNNPQFVHLSRVFKASAMDRSAVDLNVDGIYNGRITLPTLTADRVKMLMEYFWMFSFSNNTGNAVLASTTTETDTDYVHTMIEAKLTMRAAGQCDTVEVFETTYTVQKDTGDIWNSKQMVREISSKRDGSEIVTCDSNVQIQIHI